VKVSPTDFYGGCFGRNGTGKEQIARAIQQVRNVLARVYYRNCAAVPSSLISSDCLAQTVLLPALCSIDGAGFEWRLRHVFLDEIGELPAELRLPCF